jgi:hypothetical protein
MTAPTATVYRARIYVREDDRHEGKRLHEEIVDLARATRLSGATVIRGVEGFGATGAIHSAHVMRPSEDLPMIIEVVDAYPTLEPFLGRVEAILDETGTRGLITLERVGVLRPKLEERRIGPQMSPPAGA